MTSPDEKKLIVACKTLAQRDLALAHAYQSVGVPTWRTRPATYETLAQIVVYQLISTKAADAIWSRLIARYAVMTPRAILEDNDDAILACGLSRPKLLHIKAIATAVEQGDLNFGELAKAPIEQARKTLLKVRGIGPWTADTFLMNAIGHMDAFPSGDVGLIEAFKRLSDADARLSAKAFNSHAETWRPYRAVAAHLLYEWLHLERNRTSK